MGRIAVLVPSDAGGAGAEAEALTESARPVLEDEGHVVDVVAPGGEDARQRARDADLAVYHLADAPAFGDVLHVAIEVPGLLVLHQLSLERLVGWMLSRADPLAVRTRREARAGAARLARRDLEEPLRTFWPAYPVRRSRGVVVRSRFARAYLRDGGARTPVWTVPPAAPARPGASSRAVRKLQRRLSRSERDVIVGVLGDLDAERSLGAVLDAAAALGPPVRLVLASRGPVDAIRSSLAGHAVRRRVTVAGGCGEEELTGWLLASDVVVDLRAPHRGEVGEMLVRSAAEGIPAVVRSVGADLDWPSDACVRTGPGAPVGDVLAEALGSLVRDPARRREIGERARRQVAAPEEAGAVLARAAAATLKLLRDPRRVALARWAAALREVGVTEQGAGRGLGLRHPTALEALDEDYETRIFGTSTSIPSGQPS